MDTNTTRAHRSTRRRSAARGRTFLRSLLAGLLLAFGAGASALEAQAPPPEQRTPTVAYNSHPEQQNFLIVWVEDRGKGPDIYGKRIANPIGQIWSGALMLEFLGNGDESCTRAHDAIMAAVEAVLREGPHTPDLGGKASTDELGKAIAAAVAGA